MSTIRTNTLLAADGTQTTEPSIPALDQRMAKAWVTFNGVGTVYIKESYNISSITDNGVGSYFANFTTPMSNANFTALMSTVNNTDAGYLNEGASASYVGMYIRLLSSQATYDRPHNSIVVFSN